MAQDHQPRRLSGTTCALCEQPMTEHEHDEASEARDSLWSFGWGEPLAHLACREARDEARDAAYWASLVASQEAAIA